MHAHRVTLFKAAAPGSQPVAAPLGVSRAMRGRARCETADTVPPTAMTMTALMCKISAINTAD